MEKIFAVFQITIRRYFCCSKLIEIYMLLSREHLILYYDENMTKEFLRLNLSDVISINKRQLNREDINKFSIFYYKNKNTNEVSEVKLKTLSRKELDIWINRLRTFIKPAKFVFSYQNEEIGCNEYLNLIENYKKLPEKKFYSFKNLEYIIERRKKVKFFDNFKILYYSNYESLGYDSELFSGKDLPSLNIDVFEEHKNTSEFLNDVTKENDKL